MDVRRQFLAGLASATGLDPKLFDRVGTTVVGTTSRERSGAIVYYQAGVHTLVWCDPQVVGDVAELASDTHSIDAATVASKAADHGAVHVSSGDMRVLVGDPTPPAPVPTSYEQRWLDPQRPPHIDLLRAFAERNSAEDVNEAELDDLDNFNERAVNVLIQAGDARLDHVVAFASANDWHWDQAFCDIAVLVDPQHRRMGLGTLVVGHTVAALIADGRLPLYRHDQLNTGSEKIANEIGFERVTTLSYFGPKP